MGIPRKIPNVQRAKKLHLAFIGETEIQDRKYDKIDFGPHISHAARDLPKSLACL